MNAQRKPLPDALVGLDSDEVAATPLRVDPSVLDQSLGHGSLWAMDSWTVTCPVVQGLVLQALLYGGLPVPRRMNTGEVMH